MPAGGVTMPCKVTIVRTADTMLIVSCSSVAHLYEEQIFMGVFTVTQDCCQLVLNSSNKQWEMQFAMDSAAVHCCQVIAHLYEEQIFIGVFAVTQGCCQPVFNSSSECLEMRFVLDSAAVHWC